MATYPHLTNAPIVEAITEYQVLPAPDLTGEALGSFADPLEAFPNREQLGLLSLNIGPVGLHLPPAIQTVPGVAGYKFTSADRRHIIQARPQAFALSHLAPYTDGDTLRAEFGRLWQRFREVAQPQRIHRIGLRYINRIEMPLPLRDFSDYFQLFVSLPEPLPQGLAEFALRAVLPDVETPGQAATVILTLEPVGPASTAVVVLLDIDAYRIVDLAPDAAEIDDIYASLRQYKNRIFFNSLTEKALRRYQEPLCPC